MAFVRRRGMHFYLCYRDAGGRRQQVASKARTKTEAMRLADDLERREERVRLGLDTEAPQRMTWAELAAQYTKDVVPNQDSGKTTESQMKHLVALNKKLLHQITPADIERILTSKRETLSDATREKVRKRAQTMFRYAKESLRVFRGENPAALVKHIRPPFVRPKYLPADLVPRVMAAAGRDEDMLATAFFTGMRKGELCGLKAEDVDLPARVIHLRRSYKKATKGKRERIAVIPELLAPYLDRALERAAKEECVYLFPDAEGEMRTLHWDAADTFRTCLKKAGLISGYRHMCRRKGCGFREERKDDAVSRCPKCSFVLWVDAIPMAYTLKHTRSTWGTHAYAATGDIRFVQEGLGHSDISVTEDHYSHALVSHRLTQANKLSFGPGIGRSLPHMESETGSGVAVEGHSATTEAEEKQ